MITKPKRKKESLSEPIGPPIPRSFSQWKECFEDLERLKPQSEAAALTAFLCQVASSKASKLFSFRILCLIVFGELKGPVLQLRQKLQELLSSGGRFRESYEELNGLDIPRWVRREMSILTRHTEWQQFISSGDYLWILFVLLSMHQDRRSIIEGLIAFSECSQWIPKKQKRSNTNQTSTDPVEVKWIQKALYSHVDEKTGPSELFFHLVFSLAATAEESREARESLSELEKQLALEKCVAEKAIKQHETLESNNLELSEKISDLTLIVDGLKTKLEDEQLNRERHINVSSQDSRRTKNELMARVNRSTRTRLENISLYADRQNPDREEILALVKEIENELEQLSIETLK